MLAPIVTHGTMASRPIPVKATIAPSPKNDIVTHRATVNSLAVERLTPIKPRSVSRVTSEPTAS